MKKIPNLSCGQYWGSALATSLNVSIRPLPLYGRTWREIIHFNAAPYREWEKNFSIFGSPPIGYNAGMKWQIRTSTILLITACVAIACMGMATLQKLLSARFVGAIFTTRSVLNNAGIYSPVLAPIAFLAYAAGCKSLTGRMVVAFALIEVATIAFAHWCCL